ncbi:MAG: hypothetical protein Q7T16_02215 [Candidatus Burarchaeum sp.]|nr:hypothetical protein [Candidatus Burarchaeum sp.]MDO8339449.1 hypothetical protein [Candidatus Burarchaeum sp.]
MKSEQLLSVLFYAGMACWFLYAGFFPVENGYWLTYNAQAIWILEIASIFSIVPLAILLKKDFEIKPSGGPKWRWLALVGGLALILMAAAVLNYFYKLGLLSYFVISTASKIFEFRSRPGMRYEVKESSTYLAFFACAAIVAMVFPIALISKLGTWGFLYFSLMAVHAHTPLHSPAQQGMEKLNDAIKGGVDGLSGKGRP